LKLIKIKGLNYYLRQYRDKPLWVLGQKEALPFLNEITARMTIIRLQDESFREFDDLEIVEADYTHQQEYKK